MHTESKSPPSDLLRRQLTWHQGWVLETARLILHKMSCHLSRWWTRSFLSLTSSGHRLSQKMRMWFWNCVVESEHAHTTFPLVIVSPHFFLVNVEHTAKKTAHLCAFSVPLQTEQKVIPLSRLERSRRFNSEIPVRERIWGSDLARTIITIIPVYSLCSIDSSGPHYCC